jgi:hypothetical protein
MIKFFKNLFYKPVEPLKVEVTIHVPEIKVFVSGRLQEETISDSRSEARAYEDRCAEVDGSKSIDFKLEELGRKYSGETALPEVPFGKEIETEEEKE